MRLELEATRLAWEINDAAYLNEFFGLIVEGKQRIGKTAYCCQSMAEAFGEWQYEEGPDDIVYARCVKPDYETVKKWIVFPPKEFLGLIFDLPTDRQNKVLLWDDAGFWLFALDWYEPFVKAVAKYIQLAGRQFNVLLFTTPSRKMVSNKVMEAIPELLIARIKKATWLGRDSPKFKPRVAYIYERWDYPDGKKGGVYKQWMDIFDAILPDDFYNWYKPKSDQYLEIGRKILESEYRAMQRKLTKKEKEETMELVHKVVGEPDKLKEIEEILAMYEPSA